MGLCQYIIVVYLSEDFLSSLLLFTSLVLDLITLYEKYVKGQMIKMIVIKLLKSSKSDTHVSFFQMGYR